MSDFKKTIRTTINVFHVLLIFFWKKDLLPRPCSKCICDQMCPDHLQRSLWWLDSNAFSECVFIYCCPSHSDNMKQMVIRSEWGQLCHSDHKLSKTCTAKQFYSSANRELWKFSVKEERLSDWSFLTAGVTALEEPSSGDLRGGKRELKLSTMLCLVLLSFSPPHGSFILS